eukprot:869937-Prymnesium_polylepis.2
MKCALPVTRGHPAPCPSCSSAFIPSEVGAVPGSLAEQSSSSCSAVSLCGLTVCSAVPPLLTVELVDNTRTVFEGKLTC